MRTYILQMLAAFAGLSLGVVVCAQQQSITRQSAPSSASASGTPAAIAADVDASVAA